MANEKIAKKGARYHQYFYARALVGDVKHADSVDELRDPPGDVPC